MGVFKDRGMVIKEQLNAEHNKTLTLMLKERGKTVIFAKGARRPSSNFFAATQVFSYCDFFIFEGSRFMSLTQADVIKNFYGLTKDYERFHHASSFLKLIDNKILPSSQTADILYLLLKSVQAVSKGESNALLISCVFHLKFLQLEGYTPELDKCAVCGVDKPMLDGDAVYICAAGIVCRTCVYKQKPVLRIFPETVLMMKYILNLETDDALRLKAHSRLADSAEPYINGIKSACDFFINNNEA